MAEWLRRLGDLSLVDLEGPMAGFLQDLVADGRVRQVVLPVCREPQRWVMTEEESLYHRAFGLEETPAEQQHTAAEMILARFLQTHALVGLADVLERYPFEPTWAERQLSKWAENGRLVALPASVGKPLQWSAPENLEQVQRGTLALQRREVITCTPLQFVDFVLRWQGIHPATRRENAEGLTEVLQCLEGLPLPTGLWEQTVLPARVPGYQSRWLDEAIAGGMWTWACQGEDDSGPRLLGFFRREDLPDLPSPTVPGTVVLDAAAEAVLDRLHQRGASFVSDLAQQTRQPPSTVRAALWTLLRRSLVTNDRFDVIRRGEERHGDAQTRSHGERLGSYLRVSVSGRLCVSASSSRPEGRWSLVGWGQPDPETQAVRQAALLLRRYGIVARELALLDPWLLPWRVLYEVLSRLELSGEVRRGYFVEGLSGAQFALPEAAQRLQEQHLPSTAAAPVVLLHSQDPANLYGAGAPLDIPLLDGGTRPLQRRAGNWLVLRSGRPVLLVEGHGKRLTALPSAARDEVAAAVACLPGILEADRGLVGRQMLRVDEWNGQRATASEGRKLLEAVGFVRDYHGMTLYAAWR
jgi:ATP-dependent Lhr-like helicase